MLVSSLVGIASRTTMDMDVTVRGYPLFEEVIAASLTEICALPSPNEITLSLIGLAPIREEDVYGGLRATISAQYETIQTNVKIDITTGDIITPQAMHHELCAALTDRIVGIWAYPPETILAEKVETVLRRGIFNTRQRDFYDIYILMTKLGGKIDREVFVRAVQATANKRGSLAALDGWKEILRKVQLDAEMRQRWEQYRRDYPFAHEIQYDDVIEALRGLVQARDYSAEK